MSVINRRNARNIVSNTEYMDWIEDFIKDKTGFSDEWMFIIKKEDVNKKNVQKLDLFYEGIKDYAEDNFIYPTEYNFERYFNIKYHNNGYKIGVLTIHGYEFFCNKEEIEDENDFIEFMDIVNNKKQENVDKINEALNNVEASMINAHENGAPVEAILSRIDETIYVLRSKELNDEYVLSRRRIVKQRRNDEGI